MFSGASGCLSRCLRVGILGVGAVIVVSCGVETEPAAETPPTEDAVETVLVDGIPVRTDGLRASPTAYKVDTMTLELEPGEGLEYKYRLEEGQTMVYSWESTGPVRVEMHSQADDQEAREGAAEFFEILVSSTAGHGTFTAPFPGIHGWWWMNTSEEENATVTVKSSGFYSYSIEFPSEQTYELDEVGSGAD